MTFQPYLIFRKLHDFLEKTTIIMSVQLNGDYQLSDLNLDEYFVTLQKLALIQFEKLKSSGYTAQD